jgi:hypothetical protein
VVAYSKESVINPHVRKVTYDPLTSFEPICRLVTSECVATSTVGAVANRAMSVIAMFLP